VLVATGTLTLALLLFALFTFKTVHFLDLLSGHPEVASASSEPAGTPVEESPASFEVYDDLGTIDFAVVGRLVGSDEVLLGVEFHKSITSGFTFKVSDDPYRFDDTVFLQMRWHLPRIRNSDSSQ
jgi:hypothetical protein